MNCQAIVIKHTCKLAKELYNQGVTVEFEPAYKIKLRRRLTGYTPRYAYGFIELDNTPPKITFDKTLFKYAPVAAHFWDLIVHEITHLKERGHDSAFLKECELNEEKTKRLEETFKNELKELDQ